MVRRSGQARLGEEGWLSRGRTRTAAIWLLVAIAIIVLALIVGRPSDGQAGRTDTPEPTQDAGPALAFGTALDEVTGVAIGEQSAYRPGDTVAYSLTLTEPFAVASVFIAVDRVGGGDQAQVQEPTEQAVEAGRTTFGVEVPADRLIELWGPGTYRISVSLPGAEAPLATGRFTLRSGG